jgi:hypothetical protein
MDEARSSFDPGDPFGWAMGWWFAGAEVLWHEGRYLIPDDWEYRPGLVNDDRTWRDEADWETGTVAELFDEADCELADIVTFGNILARYRVWVGLAGKDY